jgi:hypothetical protein
MGHSNLVSQSSPFILQEPSLHCLADLIPFPFRIARQLILFLFLLAKSIGPPSIG